MGRPRSWLTSSLGRAPVTGSGNRSEASDPEVLGGNQSRQTYQEMAADNDAVIGPILFAIDMLTCPRDSIHLH